MDRVKIETYMFILFHDSGCFLKIIHTLVNLPFQLCTVVGIDNRLSPAHTRLSRQVQNRDEVLHIAPLDQLAA